VDVSEPGLPLVHRGKVRDVYDAGDGCLLLVASDRLSAFDVVMAEPIPGKGRVLTRLSAYFFGEIADLAPHHFLAVDPPALVAEVGRPEGRTMLVRRAEMLPIECLLRGYLAGSAWREYAERGTVHGIRLPSGLREADALEEPLFTVSTKATSGHDQNLTPAEAERLVGADVLAEAAEMCLRVYRRAAERLAAVGLILADTKIEVGWIDGRLAICDELCTPDSSRIWDRARWQPGSPPVSFDKQPVRDWLEASGWDKTPPPPPLPEEVVRATAERYATVERLLLGPGRMDLTDGSPLSGSPLSGSEGAAGRVPPGRPAPEAPSSGGEPPSGRETGEEARGEEG